MIFGGPSGPYHVTKEVGTIFAFVPKVFREKSSVRLSGVRSAAAIL
jgi:hypothetical protein